MSTATMELAAPVPESCAFAAGAAPDKDGDDLLAAVRAGEPRAFEELVRAYGGRMLAVTRGLLRNEDDAQDALQDALLSAFRSIRAFEGSSRLGTWLHRIAVNAALMRLRSRRRKPAVRMDDLPGLDEDGLGPRERPSWQDPGDLALERRELRAMVREKIDLLPPDHRQVLVLRDMEELSTEDTAAALGINPGAVKTRLHRARRALRELIEAE
jgi:RNA polymerase sigma-70 factor (ECF subfamily)